MGLFWDLYQQMELSAHSTRAGDLEDRVGRLESELKSTRDTLREVIGRLEQHVGQDLDGDGQVGV
jgi:hypothetical protein